MPFNTLRFETDDNGITTIIINRPSKLNALNNELLKELAEAFLQVSKDEQIKGVLLVGAGDKAFVAGADIKELQSLDKAGGTTASKNGQQVFQTIENSRKPVIAVVNGYALGGGAELAMACHLRIASPKAVFGFPEVGLGLIPGYGGTQRLTKIVGQSRALELILTAKHIKAGQALQMGLVNSVSDEPVVDARELLAEIFSNGPLAIGSALEAVYSSNSEEGFYIEAELFGKLCETEDAKEGITAFLEKRKPEFKGE